MVSRYVTPSEVIWNLGIQQNESLISQYWRGYSIGNLYRLFSFLSKKSSVSQFQIPRLVGIKVCYSMFWDCRIQQDESPICQYCRGCSYVLVVVSDFISSILKTFWCFSVAETDYAMNTLSIRRRDFTWKVRRDFIDFERRIHVEIFISTRH